MPGRRSFLRRALGVVVGLVAAPAAAKAGGAAGYAEGGRAPAAGWIGDRGVEILRPRKPLAYCSCWVDAGKVIVDPANLTFRFHGHAMGDACGLGCGQSDPCDPWPERA